MPHSLPAAPGGIRIGCSGWNYRHWRSAFYPDALPVKRWFEHYAGTFDTVEINNSFYRLPSTKTFAKWRDQAPAGFRFAVKANRFLTQAKKLKDCAEPIERMMAAIRGLGETIGPILYQLPPRFRVNLERLDSFLEVLPGEFDHVFEFREASWHSDEVLALLERHGASFCTHDMPGLDVPRRAVGPLAYVRFHGAAGKYWGRYPEESLRGWRDWIVAQSRLGREVWVFFNNDIHADAIADALALRRLVEETGDPAPSA